MKYCRYCGMELVDGQCNCYEFQASIGNATYQPVQDTKKDSFLISFAKPNFSSFRGFVSSIREMCGMSEPNSSFADPYERNIPIVPGCIPPVENEVTIRQYNIAKLRTRLKLMSAEGRLMVTNKRVLFRAAGTSLTGNTLQEHQFNLDEIGGIEIHKDYKFSPMNFLGALLLAVLSVYATSFLLTKIGPNATVVCGIFLGLLGLVPTFVIYKHFWLKLFWAEVGMGLLNTAFSASDDNGFIFILLAVSQIIVLFNTIIVWFVPNLVLKIKTKGAEGAISIGSDKAMFMRRSRKDYTGYAEILPWEDTVQAINELGTLIDDLQKQGDYAIEKWSF